MEYKNIKEINAIFKGCSLIKTLPDISKWNTENIIEMKFLFNECTSLINLPDISKWNMEEVITIEGMFKGCSSLKSLPNISKWNTLSLKNKHDIFLGCSSLKSFPEIKIRNIINIALTGATCVGCNCLFGAALGLEYREDLPCTIGNEKGEFIFLYNNSKFKVILWHGAGQERFMHMTEFFLKKANIILFVYEITNQNSLEHLNIRINLSKDVNQNDFIGAIIANKNDLYDERKVSDEQGKEFAKKYNYKFYSASAKNNPEGFRNFIEELIKDYIASCG